MKIWQKIKYNKQLNNQGMKLVVSMAFALLISILLSNFLFYTDSPQPKQQAFSNFKQFIAKVINLDFDFKVNLESQLAEIPQVVPPNNLDFTPIAPGVNAATDLTTNERYVKIDQGTQIQIQEYTLKDGRKIKVITPLSQ